MNTELFKKLAYLSGYSGGYFDKSPSCIPDYMNWDLLMPLAIEHDVIQGPIDDQYEAVIWEKGSCCEWCDLSKISATDKTPQIAIVKCLIEKLEGENAKK